LRSQFEHKAGIGQEDLMAILSAIVGIDRSSDDDWFALADEVLASVAFAAVQQNPVSELPAGVNQLPYLGGLRADAGQPVQALQAPDGSGVLYPLPLGPTSIEFLLAPNDVDGQAVATTDELVVVLTDGGVEVTEVEPALLGGLEARVFDIGSGTGPQLLTRSSDTEALWAAPFRGRLWVAEHPQ
jgi:hypothetical protein